MICVNTLTDAITDTLTDATLEALADSIIDIDAIEILRILNIFFK